MNGPFLNVNIRAYRFYRKQSKLFILEMVYPFLPNDVSTERRKIVRENANLDVNKQVRR